MFLPTGASKLQFQTFQFVENLIKKCDSRSGKSTNKSNDFKTNLMI